METSNFTVMLVDDTEANIDVLVNTLEDMYDVRVAMDGETALEDIMQEPPDLILLDIMMPGIDGYEVCRRLKSDITTQNIPIIFITALSQVEDETKGLKLGAVDYITKPISPPIVKARVENHLALKKAREDLEKQNSILQENINLREEIDRISRHDLKTPLNSIISIPRILLQDSNKRLEPDQVELIEVIEKSGHTMLSMINLSLDLFKMEKGNYRLNPVAFNILSIIKKIIFDLRSLTDAKGIKFNLLINDPSNNWRAASDNDEFGVLGEELLCYSMFANIIKNAVEASPENGIITISLSNSTLSKSLNLSESSKDGIEQSKINIHNRGVVPESIRESFFDKYATAGKKGGTGLGTYSAKLMAQTLGGDIAMSTSEHDGTTITVNLKYAPIDKTLPSQSLLFKPSLNNKEKDFCSPSGKYPNQFQFPTLRIMIVDDDEYNRFILKKYLNHPKLTIELAEDGLSALNKFKEHSFDIIFMDMEMPIMDGMEAATLIREWESNQNNIEYALVRQCDTQTPNKDKKSVIVALSGHDDPNTYQACLNIGFDDYLSKPVNSVKLFETILKFFSIDNKHESVDIDSNSNFINIDSHSNVADIHCDSNIIEIDSDLEDLIPSFLSDKKSEIEKISQLLKTAYPHNENEPKPLTENDYKSIQQLGHRLKGGFNMYGFKEQGAISSVIEDAAKNQNFDKIQNNVDLLKSSLNKIEVRYVNMD
ncbi:MAG: response regulator [Desulfamplus sp.]|nr:response regulator [Desulfamplus sp.]